MLKLEPDGYWLRDLDADHRRKMFGVISQILQQENPDGQDSWFDPLPARVKKLEELLYISASSLGEYNDLSALKLRLKHVEQQQKGDAWFKYRLMKCLRNSRLDKTMTKCSWPSFVTVLCVYLKQTDVKSLNSVKSIVGDKSLGLDKKKDDVYLVLGAVHWKKAIYYFDYCVNQIEPERIAQQPRRQSAVRIDIRTLSLYDEGVLVENICPRLDAPFKYYLDLGINFSLYGFKLNEVALVFNQHVIKPSDTPAQLGMQDGDVVYITSTSEPRRQLLFVNNESSNEYSMTIEPYDWTQMRMSTIFALYQKWLHADSGKRTQLKSLRFTHNNSILFFSSFGKKAPECLDMKHGDKIYVTTIDSGETATETVAGNSSTKKSGALGNKGKKQQGTSIKRKKKAPVDTYSTIDEDERLRRIHSKAISHVFEEAEVKHFKTIRMRLNAMVLERTEPKVKLSRAKPVESEPDISLTLTTPSKPSDGVKTRFVVHIGEVANLYKSTKPSKKRRKPQKAAIRDPITVDLHGMTKAVAVETLDKLLPQWVDSAMRGEYPFVIRVAIVCGRGSQILSEAVEGWIKDNVKVANAPKNLLL